MEREAEYHRHRAQELRAIAYFIADGRKQDLLLWLAHGYEKIAEQGTAEPASLVRRLHMLRVAEQLRPLGRLESL